MKYDPYYEKARHYMLQARVSRNRARHPLPNEKNTAWSKKVLLQICKRYVALARDMNQESVRQRVKGERLTATSKRDEVSL